MKRINNPSKYLKGIVKDGQTYYIGFGLAHLTDTAKSTQGIRDLISGKIPRYIVTGKKSVLKENTNGKFVRKQPEVKSSVWKHIEYYSTKHSKQIKYDREFFIWEKELSHKYNLELKLAQTPQNEHVLYFPKLKMEDTESHSMLAGAEMNMCIVLGSYHLIYDSLFEPIIPVTQFKDKRLLPAGNYSTVEEKLKEIEKSLIENKGSSNNDGDSYRFAFLKTKKTDDVTMGLGGFNDYLMFEYQKNDIIILENLRNNNATYIFSLSKFNKDKALNKQNAVNDPSFLKRVVHDNVTEWSRALEIFFT